MEEVPEILRKRGYVAFAEVHIKKCKKESKPNDEIDKELHAELVKLDTRLGLQTITIWNHHVFAFTIIDFTFVQFLFIIRQFLKEWNSNSLRTSNETG